MKRTEAIQKFLHAQTYDIAKLYTPEMEVQVNVAQDNGEIISGVYNGKNWRAYTDGLQTWKSFRIPLGANSNPEYIDNEIKFDISQHTEAIGMSGWDYINKLSRWVGFDFDSMIEHKKGLDNQSIAEIREKLSKLSYINIYTSTSGNGLHVYVMLKNPVTTQNHVEH